MMRNGRDGLAIQWNGPVNEHLIKLVKRLSKGLIVEFREHLEHPNRGERRRAKAKKALRRKKKTAARRRAVG